MLRLGIIGLNEGNGHPYSFSAIFNGFDPQRLEECPFAAIREYLPLHHRNEIMISSAKVTHIWTQDASVSESVCRVSKISHVVSDPSEMIGEIDAVILARDDVENHWTMAVPFIKAGLPIYIDKLLAPSLEGIDLFARAVPEGYPIMAGSSSRYTPLAEDARRLFANDKGVRAIHGVSNVNWVRYASHVLDGIFHVFGSDIEWVQNTGRDGHDVVQLFFSSGLRAVVQIVHGLSLPIEFSIYSTNRPGHHRVLFTDEGFGSYFMGFYRMLEAFVGMVESGRPPMPFSLLMHEAKVIVAAEISKARNGAEVRMDSIS